MAPKAEMVVACQGSKAKTLMMVLLAPKVPQARVAAATQSQANRCAVALVAPTKQRLPAAAVEATGAEEEGCISTALLPELVVEVPLTLGTRF